MRCVGVGGGCLVVFRGVLYIVYVCQPIRFSFEYKLFNAVCVSE